VSTHERKNPAQQEVSQPSAISSNLFIHGNIITPGEVRIDGTIEGDIEATKITVGEKGSITGNINADTIDVHGDITSRIINLKATAHVIGDTTHEVISIDKGACLDGKFKGTG
jgi:cytoskeletal protein CcmA (bactofilin family)